MKFILKPRFKHEGFYPTLVRFEWQTIRLAQWFLFLPFTSVDPGSNPTSWGRFHKEVKPLYMFGNCQRPVFSLCVSKHVHKITNLWKFELNWSSKLGDMKEIKNNLNHTKLCAFRCLILRPQILNLRSRNQIPGKLLLSRKLHHFRGSRFSQCFILPTSPHY